MYISKEDLDALERQADASGPTTVGRAKLRTLIAAYREQLEIEKEWIAVRNIRNRQLNEAEDRIRALENTLTLVGFEAHAATDALAENNPDEADRWNNVYTLVKMTLKERP